ncbi:uncharacterized protein LOC115924939, partial [Strongylocentrotus purpuratus]|uniref:Peptidase S8/S53 domain-containing protein n=1 Tax=Strongylocentrotus purpuratus TaxID=7668 RepID=A0A7M7NZD4_STRPU
WCRYRRNFRAFNDPCSYIWSLRFYQIENISHQCFVSVVPEGGLDILRSLPGVAYVEEDEIITADAVEWGLDRIDQRDLPLNGEMNIAGTGAGAHVYVIDSGIYTDHEDFGSRASVAADFIGGDGQDCNGHGTHCAGTVAGNTYGVAKQASVYALRTLSCSGSGYKSDSIAGKNTLPR